MRIEVEEKKKKVFRHPSFGIKWNQAVRELCVAAAAPFGLLTFVMLMQVVLVWEP